MPRTWFGLLAFAGGVAVGLLIAKEYARETVAGDVAKGFTWLGFGGGTSQKIGDLFASQAIG